MLSCYFTTAPVACTPLHRNLGRLQPPKATDESLAGPPSALQPRAMLDENKIRVGDPPPRAPGRSSSSGEGGLSSPPQLVGAAARERAAFELMLRAVGAAVAPKLPTFSGNALAAVPAGLAACGFVDAPLLLAWERACLGGALRRTAPRDLAAMARALGSLGLIPGPR